MIFSRKDGRGLGRTGASGEGRGNCVGRAESTAKSPRFLKGSRPAGCQNQPVIRRSSQCHLQDKARL